MQNHAPAVSNFPTNSDIKIVPQTLRSNTSIVPVNHEHATELSHIIYHTIHSDHGLFCRQMQMARIKERRVHDVQRQFHRHFVPNGLNRLRGTSAITNRLVVTKCAIVNRNPPRPISGLIRNRRKASAFVLQPPTIESALEFAPSPSSPHLCHAMHRSRERQLLHAGREFRQYSFAVEKGRSGRHAANRTLRSVSNRLRLFWE